MDLTALASSLLHPVPAHRAFGIEVTWAGDAVGRVVMDPGAEHGNVMGALHSSGLTALVDAGGLAAIVGACHHETDFDRVLPLGRSASLDFYAPARGVLTASCSLDLIARRALEPLLTRGSDRARLATSTAVVDTRGELVCEGTFQWSLRRLSESA
jgi:acyl-coenzyme A thioesterase PaaI-like protein